MMKLLNRFTVLLIPYDIEVSYKFEDAMVSLLHHGSTGLAEGAFKEFSHQLSSKEYSVYITAM